MFDWLRKQIRRTEVRQLPLTFVMDRTDDDQHVVQVYKQVDGRDEPVTNPKAMWHFGYKEEIETEQGKTLYRLNEPDRQTLLALRSLNPQVEADGRLRFPFAPPILNYLRTKENLGETEASEKLQVSNKPLKAAAQIDYKPGVELTVEIGYQVEGTKNIVRPENVRTTADGNYMLAGDTFVPLPKSQDPKIQEWLKQPKRTIPFPNIPEFFQRDLVLLKKEFTAVLTDLATQIRIIQTPLKPVVKVDKGEPGWLDFTISYQAGDFVLPPELLAKKKNDPFVQLDEYTWVKNDPQAIQRTEKRLRELEAEPTISGYRTPASQFASLEDFIESIGGKAELSAAYQAFLDQLTGFEVDENFQLSPATERQLKKVGIVVRPYQRAGIHWLDWLFNNRLHGLLADDMGLGKTLQSICLLRRAYEQTNSRQPTLILTPKSVILHWKRELNRFFPEIRTYEYHGPTRRKDYLQALEPIIFISTYETAVNDLQILQKVPFFYIILDEASRVKNPDAQRTQAAKALNGAYRLALSGTPVENRPAEMWSLFDFLIRGHLGKYGTFQRVFENPISAGDAQVASKLGRRVKPFMLRRLKKDVAQDLPEKIELDEWCELSSEQRELYGGLQDEVKQIRESLRQGETVNYAANILPILTKLKQICDHPALVIHPKEPILGRSEKFDWIVNKIEEIHQQSEQVVVFSHFLGMLDLLEKALLSKKIRYIRMDGSTNNRQALIDKFNSSMVSVALCSIQAMGYGINLTAANHVIHADRWWNPATEDQATDRVHRIGQDKTVYIYRIMVKGTLEERIDWLLSNKRAIAGQIVDAANEGARKWSREELLELLRPLD